MTPLVIFECERHGLRFRPAQYERAPIDENDDRVQPCCRPVRFFREEDVRPLWEVAAASDPTTGSCAEVRAAARIFPAPEGWKR